MLVRTFHEADTDQVMQLWLNGNTDAHPFISKDYWQSHFAPVREQITQAEIFVCETESEIQGFIGIADSYIAGIFVDRKHRSLGIGKALLDYAKQRHLSLSLNVYQKNKRAVSFYLREGFQILSEGLDESTKEKEYLMGWNHNSCDLQCVPETGEKTGKSAFLLRKKMS